MQLTHSQSSGSIEAEISASAQVSVVPIPMTSKQIAQHALHLYGVLAAYAEDFLHPASALAWLSRARPARTGKITVPPEHRWPKSVHGVGGYIEAFRALGLTQRVHETKLGHWHWHYWCPKRVCLEAMQLALTRRWREAQMRAYSMGMGHLPHQSLQMTSPFGPTMHSHPHPHAHPTGHTGHAIAPMPYDMMSTGGMMPLVSPHYYPSTPQSISWNYVNQGPPMTMMQPQQTTQPMSQPMAQSQPVAPQQTMMINGATTHMYPSYPAHPAHPSSLVGGVSAAPRIEHVYSRITNGEQQASEALQAQQQQQLQSQQQQQVPPPVHSLQPASSSASSTSPSASLPFAPSRPVSPRSLTVAPKHSALFQPYPKDRSPPMPIARRPIQVVGGSLSKATPSSAEVAESTGATLAWINSAFGRNNSAFSIVKTESGNSRPVPKVPLAPIAQPAPVYSYQPPSHTAPAMMTMGSGATMEAHSTPYWSAHPQSMMQPYSQPYGYSHPGMMYGPSGGMPMGLHGGPSRILTGPGPASQTAPVNRLVMAS